MAILRVIQPQEVTVYSCDGPFCNEVCESVWTSQCGWLQVEVQLHPYRDDEAKRLAFCSWTCLSDLSKLMQMTEPFETREPEPYPVPPF
jgi:hypothetical protein